MIVLDANVIAYFMLKEQHTRYANLATALIEKHPQCCLPSVWRHEFMNVLSKYLRGGFLDLSKAERTWSTAMAYFSDFERPMPHYRVLELSFHKGLSGYDAQYLALAEAENGVLVTEDKKLRAAAPELCRSMEEMLA